MQTVRFDELEGSVLEGKYRLERVIGRGGMAVVYEATHLGLDRRVAVKMLSGAMAERSDMARRMIREAKTASAIGHPNIVLVTDLGWHLGAPFITGRLEYLQGVTLAAELSEREADAATRRRSRSCSTCSTRSTPCTGAASSTATSNPRT
ncbi:MAG: protein kinase [Nannocystaceae bacterium]